MAYQEGWVTIRGNHVYIENGVITKGPKALVGKSREEASGKKSKNYMKDDIRSKLLNKPSEDKSFIVDKDIPDKPLNAEERKASAQKELSRIRDFDPEYNDDSFTMTKGDREVTVTKHDGKWVDSEGNKYMGYLSKQDVKSYFRGGWEEKGSNASQIISDQLTATRNAKIEVANALGVKFEYENQWKSTDQLYREQKGIDLAENAINSKDVVKYNNYVKEHYSREDKNWSDRADIDRYAKENNLHADSLYYMTKLGSEADRSRLDKAAKNFDFEKSINEGYNRFHGKTDKEISDAKDYVRKKQYRDEYYDRLTPEQKKIIDSAYKKGIQDYEREKAIGERIGDQIVKSYKNYMKAHPNSKLSEADFKKMKRG